MSFKKAPAANCREPNGQGKAAVVIDAKGVKNEAKCHAFRRGKPSLDCRPRIDGSRWHHFCAVLVDSHAAGQSRAHH